MNHATILRRVQTGRQNNTRLQLFESFGPQRETTLSTLPGRWRGRAG